jgi:hypothetical protein
MIRDDVLYEVIAGDMVDDKTGDVVGDGTKISTLLAIGVEIFGNGQRLGFSDTSRPRTFLGKLVRETDEGFVWRKIFPDEDRSVLIYFAAVPIDHFDKYWVHYVAGIKPGRFKSSVELWKWYSDAFQNDRLG